jgi:hypothetical protein
MKKPKTVKSMNQVWNKLMEYIGQDKELEKEAAKVFNMMLDELLSNDFFGTEGQNDPRGDHRD